MLRITCLVCGSDCYSSVTPHDHVSPECPRCGADLRHAGAVEATVPKLGRTLMELFTGSYPIFLDFPSFS